MSRLSIAAACLLMASVPATALVGGAPAASPDAAQIVIMLSGSQGGFCSGVVLAQHLALTAAHCVLPGADYKLIDRDISGLVKLKHISAIARHPQFDADAALRHRVTADVALLRLAVPMPVAPATLAPSGSVAVGDRFIVLGYGVATPSDGSSGGTVRAATLVATGQPGMLQFRLVDPATKNERAGLGACDGDSGAPVLRDVHGTPMVVGVVSWSTGPMLGAGCGGLTGVTPLARYRRWIVEQAGRMGSPLQ